MTKPSKSEVVIQGFWSSSVVVDGETRVVPPHVQCSSVH